MNIIDVVIILIILLCALMGWKKGVIKSLVQLVGLIAVLILAYYLKDEVANFLMDKLPFFNFKGFEGITSINILIYEMVSFVVIFVLLYCILSILINISGLIEKILKVTVVLAIPSKLLGAILGLIEGIVISFVVTFLLLHLGPTREYVIDSELGVVLLERTPFMGDVMARTTLAWEDISEIIEEMTENENKEEVNARVIQVLVHYQIVSNDDIIKLIENGKMDLGTIKFG